MGLLNLKKKRKDPTPNLDRYGGWVKRKDLDEAESYAGQINDQQGTLVALQQQLLTAQENLRNHRASGETQATIDAQVVAVNGLVRKVREAEGTVREMRAFAKFNWPKKFPQ